MDKVLAPDSTQEQGCDKPVSSATSATFAQPVRLAMFDLDLTLLEGDTDQLWCMYLIERGLLDREMEPHNARWQQQYKSGRVNAMQFCRFYAGLLKGHEEAASQHIRDEFFEEVLWPRIPPMAKYLVELHRDGGDSLLLTTASSHFLVMPVARKLGFDAWIATTWQLNENRIFTGELEGRPNMGVEKVRYLRQWLKQRNVCSLAEMSAILAGSTFYSDSIKDLPLLKSVGCPVVMNPDARLLKESLIRGWPVRRLW